MNTNMSTNMSSTMSPKDTNFAYRVRHALNEKLDEMPADAGERLARARQMAMARKKKDAPARVAAARRVLAGEVNLLMNEPLSWLTRASMLIPLLALVAGIAGLYQLENEQRITDTADIDAAMLSDELPLDAYLDQGFNAFLKQKSE